MVDKKFKNIVGKNILVVLKTGRIYNGLVTSQNNNFIFITDKYNKPVTINSEEISSLEEK